MTGLDLSLPKRITFRPDQRPEAMDHKPFTIAIASGKGGTGKTMLATNYAAWLCRLHPTLLVDMDVEEPNAHIFIKGEEVSTIDQHRMIPDWIENKCTLCGECTRICNFNAIIQLNTSISVFEQLCHSCYACSELCEAGALPIRPHKIGIIRDITNNGLRFLEGRLEPGEQQPVPLIQKLHYLVRNSYNNIPIHIYDCPPGTSCSLVAATQYADYVILVTEPTPFGLNDLKLAADTMRLLEKDFGVVINRDGIGNTKVEMYCRDEGIIILEKIPYDRKIAEINARGELMHRNPMIATKFENILHAIPQQT